jgi:hypothetical protein
LLLLLLRWVGGLGIISGLHALPVPLVGGFLIVQDAPLADKVSWADVADKGGILAVVAAVLSALTTCKAAAATAVAGTLPVGMAHLDLSHPPYSNLWWVSLAGAACRVAGMSQSDCTHSLVTGRSSTLSGWHVLSFGAVSSYSYRGKVF